MKTQTEQPDSRPVKRLARFVSLLPPWARSWQREDARDGLLLIGGTAIGQALIVIVTPILTRLYTPADFGLLGLFSAFVTGAAVVVSLRYEIAIPSASKDEAAQLLFVALLVAVPLSLLASALLLLMRQENLWSYGLLPRWMAIAAGPAIYSASAGASLRYWLIRARRFRDVGIILITQGTGRAIVPVVLGLGSFFTGGLIAGEVAGRVFGIARPLAEAAPELPPPRAFILSRQLRDLLGRYWKLPVISMPSSLVDVLSMSLPVVLITQLYGASQAGLFLLVQRIISLPTSLVGFSAADVFHVRLSEEVAKGLPAMRSLVYATALRLTTIGLLFIVPLAAIAPFVAVPFLGKAWGDAGVLMIILAPWSLAGLVVSPLSRVLAVTFKLELKVVYDVTALGFVFLALEVARARNVEFLGAMLAMSLLRVMAYIIYLAVILYALRDNRRKPASQ